MGESEQKALFESMGIHEVERLVDTHRLNNIAERRAITWLAERNQDRAALRKNSFQFETLEIARPANDAAWEFARAATKAHKIAAAAFVMATIAIIVSVISMVKSS